MRFPFIGHDYANFLPRLLDGRWHMIHGGLTPYWYTPHLGGGLPVYGNPEDGFYSLVQWLSYFLNPWIALQTGSVLALSAGYAGWHLFGRDVLRLQVPWAHVYALIMVANGFYMLHMAVGHFTYHTFPLLGWWAWVLFERRRDTLWSLTGKAVLFSIVVGCIFYAGGHFAVFLGLLLTLFMLPFELILCGEPVRTRLRVLLPRLALCGTGALLLCASKLMAVYSLMRFFPRTAGLPHFPADISILSFIAKSLWAIPQHEALFAGAFWGPHEQSVFLSPVTLIGLVVGIPLFAGFLRRRRSPSRRILQGILLCYVLVLLVFCTQLIRGYGLLVDPLFAHFPFSSMRVSQRFTLLPAYFAAAGGVWSLSFVLRRLPKKETMVAAALCLGTTVACFAFSLYPILHQLAMQYNYAAFVSLLEKARTDSASPVERIGDFSDVGAVAGRDSRDDQLVGNNNIVRTGPVQMVWNGAFNMMNPSCYQFPGENHCRPGDRITLADRENLDRFRRGLPTSWKISSLQYIANLLSMAMVCFCLVFTLWRITWRIFR